MKNKQKTSFFTDSCEFITIELLERIEETKKTYDSVGIGVYSDELIEKIYHRKSIRPYKERAQIVNYIKGVDFVFWVNEMAMTEIVNPEIADFSSNIAKEYNIGYAPGTYDLLHTGHIEHLLEARKKCKILVVGINNDKLVKSYKNKTPMMTAKERAKIVSNLKFVDGVFIANELERAKANKWIMKKFGSTIDAVFIGSDWQGTDLHNPEGFNIVFTDRDPELMKKRSSTFYREQIKKILEK